ncbi:MAG: hypothetical protein ACJA13_003416 [Paraglaciecola sp.]|jgi:hypothetical protein
MHLAKSLFVAAMFVIASTSVDAQEARGQGGVKHERRPPPEALEACVDKAQGDAVTFETRRGDSLSGTCEMIENNLVAVPDNAPRD